MVFESILGWLVGALVLAVVSALLSLLLYILSFANLKRTLFIGKLRHFLRDLPDEVPLVCKEGEVFATYRQSATAGERRVPLYSGGITWKDGSRLAGKVKRAAARQFPLRMAIFFLLFLPLLGGSLYYSFVSDWKLLGVTAALVVHQFFPFTVFAHPALVDLFEGVR